MDEKTQLRVLEQLKQEAAGSEDPFDVQQVCCSALEVAKAEAQPLTGQGPVGHGEKAEDWLGWLGRNRSGCRGGGGGTGLVADPGRGR